MYKILLWWDIVIAIFWAVKVNSYSRNNIYWRSLPNYCYLLSKPISKMLMASLRAAIVCFSYMYFNRFFVNRRIILHGILNMLWPFWIIYLSVIKNNDDSSTKRMRNLSSVFEKGDSQWKKIFNCHLEIWQKTPSSIISPMCFHPNHVEKSRSGSVCHWATRSASGSDSRSGSVHHKTKTNVGDPWHFLFRSGSRDLYL